MAKKSKDAAASSAKTGAKTKAPLDPVKARNLVTLLNTLAILLAIAAFLFQLFAVLTHAWKYQLTSAKPLLAPEGRPAQAYVPDDSLLLQSYGLFSRHAKVYSNSDEQLSVDATTRFPRPDGGDDDLNQCLARTSTYRAALLTCNRVLKSPGVCHCRRYAYWNAVIFFEIAALVLLGLVVVLVALFTTHFRQLLKLAAAGLAFLAFLFLLVGLILILSHLKRETRTIADTYPHIYSRLGNQLGKGYQTVLHKAIRREAHETYRAYSLAANQRAYNDTHLLEYSQQQNAWIAIPYSSVSNANYAPRSQTGTTTTARPLRNAYGPVIGYNDVYAHTRARIGFSTVLSILATILSLLLPALLAYSWLTGKNLASDPKTVTTTTTTVETKYVPLPQEVVIAETVPLNQPTIVREEHPTAATTTTTYRS